MIRDKVEVPRTASAVPQLPEGPVENTLWERLEAMRVVESHRLPDEETILRALGLKC